jgi:hypothetical protein
MQRGVADELDGIAQSQGEDGCRRLVGVVIEEAQATTAHEGIGMVKRRDLDPGNGSVGCNGRPSLGRRGYEPVQEAHGLGVLILPALPTARTRRGRRISHVYSQA